MPTTILTLVENTVRRAKLLAEHGLSFLIQTQKETVLFDTGQGKTVLANADSLKVDINTVDRIVLSHGHFDHTGGLRHVLKRIGPRDVLAHPDALLPKYSVLKGEVREIGIPDSRKALEKAGARFVLSTGPVEVAPGVTATGCVPRVTPFEVVGERFQARSNGDWAQDDIWDDQALIVQTSKGPVVVLGCAHAGLINTLLYASELVGGKRFAAVVGGTHLVDADKRRIQLTLEALEQFEIARFAPCHCTGFDGQVALLGGFRDRFALNETGVRIRFE
jgi:7,8-dihydropterin-6-yl-methyl-4-(beta-D-ribofuranosyl)aminobenzene 5'-phosphate synthase